MKTGFIDWAEEDLHLYIFEKKGRQFVLADTQSFPLEGEPEPSSLSSLALTGVESVYLSVPLNMLTLREHRFPFSDRDKIRDTISFELEGLLLGNTSDYSIDHIITESLATGSKVLAVCMEKSRLKEIINFFSSVGADPKVVTCIDLWLYGGSAENTLGKPMSDKSLRAETARQELLNPSINLRKDQLAYTGDIERFHKSLRLTAVLTLALLLILSAHSALRLSSARNENRLLTEHMQSIYRSVFPKDKKVIDPERQFRGNLNSLRKKKAALGGIPVLDILREVAHQKHKNVTLHEFSSDGKTIRMKGSALAFEDVESVKNSLASLFDNVKVMDSSAGADKKINFTIVMQEKAV